jgi:sulfur relay (sulfurtransferase) complex TusBCD TusD component (DsrE family)
MNRSLLTYDGPSGTTLGLVIHASPGKPSFDHAVQAAQSALESSCEVYVYLLDDAVDGVMQPSLLALIAKGAKVSACGYAMEKRGMDCPEDVCPAGLTTLSDILFYSDCVSVYN